MVKLAAIEPESSHAEIVTEVPPLKPPATKRQVASPVVVKTSVAPPANKKGLVTYIRIDLRFLFFRVSKDIQPIEIIPDEPEPLSFAGQLLITGISLSCRLITAEIQQSNLYRLIKLPSITNLTMPLPIIPILQSGPSYPGKQTIIKYFMLIPTPEMFNNDEVDDRHFFMLF